MSETRTPLERCIACDEAISATAPACPRCGHVYEQRSVFGTVFKVLAAIAVIGVLGAAASCVVCSATAHLH